MCVCVHSGAARLNASPPPYAVYARIKVQLENEHWRPEAGEEFEDSLGNVLDRRTYDDLARQGLL